MENQLSQNPAQSVKVSSNERQSNELNTPQDRKFVGSGEDVFFERVNGLSYEYRRIAWMED